MEEFQNIFSLGKPDVLGISIRNIRFYSERFKRRIFYYEDLRPLLNLIRQQNSRVSIIAGGPGFSMFPQRG